MEYNKLVRDKIIEIIKKDGFTPFFHEASEAEYSKKLIEKLKEEVEEFSQNPSEEEIADILEVVDAICKVKKWDSKKINSIRQNKNLKRGSFDKKIILERTEKN